MLHGCNVHHWIPSFFFQAEDGIRDLYVTGVQTCALPILSGAWRSEHLGFLVRECRQFRTVLYYRMGLAAGRRHSDQRDSVRLWGSLQHIHGIEGPELDSLGLRPVLAAGHVRPELQPAGR